MQSKQGSDCSERERKKYMYFQTEKEMNRKEQFVRDGASEHGNGG